MDELLTWLAALDPGFAFLLALPFAVAAVALIADAVRAARQRERTPKAYRPTRFKRRVWGL